MKLKSTLLALLISLTGIFIPLQLRSIERVTYTADGLIEEAFVTYATSNYFPLVEVLLDSIKVFSTRPIVVFGINADVPFSEKKYPFMIKNRIDIESLSARNICFAKPKVILESGVLKGIYVDADIILNDGFDALFENCKRDINYPICPVFPWEVDNQQPLMQALGISDKTMQYIHAPLIIFGVRCIPFIQEWHQVNIGYGHLAPCYDETVLNVLLWKYNANDCINLCDPFYALVYDYLDGGTSQHLTHGYENWVGRIDFLTFHGCKDPATANEILKKLIAKTSK